MQSKAKTVKQYLKELPEDRREALEALRRVILANLDADYEEGMQYGMIGYYVPHSVYPSGYHCDPKQPLPFAGIASQKNHMAIYLFCIYCEPGGPEWFQEAWAKEAAKGKAGRLDMGKSCVRFKKIEDVPLSVIGKTIKRMPAKKFIAIYESGFGASRAATTSESGTKKKTKKKTAKKSAARTTTGETASKKKVARKHAKKKTVTKPAARKTTAKMSSSKRSAVRRSR